MTKTIKILDYEGTPVPIKIKDFENVVKLDIDIISGDEVLTVYYKDYSISKYDSCYILNNWRYMDFYDDSYTIYDITKNIDYIKNWKKRKSSYRYNLKGEE